MPGRGRERHPSLKVAARGRGIAGRLDRERPKCDAIGMGAGLVSMVKLRP